MGQNSQTQYQVVCIYEDRSRGHVVPILIFSRVLMRLNARFISVGSFLVNSQMLRL